MMNFLNLSRISDVLYKKYQMQRVMNLDKQYIGKRSMQGKEKVDTTKEQEKISEDQIQIGHAIFKKCGLSFAIGYEEQVYFLNSYSIRIVYARDQYDDWESPRQSKSYWIQLLGTMEISFHPYVQLKGFIGLPIIQAINQCSFVNLKSLDLSDNAIVSIEALAFLEAQNLLSINLSDNCITILKPIAKLALKYLENFYVELEYGQRIVKPNFSLVEISRMKMPKAKIDHRSIGWMDLQDLSVFVKTEGHFFSRQAFQKIISKTKIKQHRVYLSLAAKNRYKKSQSFRYV